MNRGENVLTRPLPTLPFLREQKQYISSKILYSWCCGEFPADGKDYAYQRIPGMTVIGENISIFDRETHTKRTRKLTDETRDLREQIEVPHCLQASELPSRNCGGMLEVTS